MERKLWNIHINSHNTANCFRNKIKSRKKIPHKKGKVQADKKKRKFLKTKTK